MPHIKAAFRVLLVALSVLLALVLAVDRAADRQALPADVVRDASAAAPQVVLGTADHAEGDPGRSRPRITGHSLRTTQVPHVRAAYVAGRTVPGVAAPAAPAAAPPGTVPSRSGEVPIALQVFRC